MEYRVTVELLDSNTGETRAEHVLLSDCGDAAEYDDGFIGDVEHALDEIRDDALELLPAEY